MCKAVSDCVDWIRLGLELGLKYSRLQKIEIKRLRDVPNCMRDMIAAWLGKKDKVVKEGVPTWKQLIQALKNIGEISLGEEIMKQRGEVSNPVRSTKEKSRRDLSTDEKRSVKKRKKEIKKRRKSSDTDSDNEERGETHRYKKRKIELGSDSSDNEKEEMTSKVKRKRIESSFDSHESSNIKKRRLESSDDDERSVASKVQGKGPASGKPYKRKRIPKNKTDSKSEHDDSDSEPSSKRR